ncbi:aspartyl-phosphate phosphatase Spo0E family protein [Caldanaerobacter subterraneus]|uniref:Spo0E family sporulation regulatory protein-aspartic acid phosphatase n=1 Tax=Caldanaerobacter subterraneus TaxID=911092 RepID=A0A7Y2LAR8_9THEO|nr:aspartyl-phosphate phosphatase Spo0E family protein [Caldanaerobacter subterraneus]NNG67546.1 Spo0E family sporulation regulatory protein-aspartic acid phosphatase [Caldanaerobacter subterraneus]
MINKIDEIEGNSMILYKIALLDERIEKIRAELNNLIEENADKARIIELSHKLDILILEYMKLKGWGENDIAQKK